MAQADPNLRTTVLANPTAEAVIPLVPPNDDQVNFGRHKYRPAEICDALSFVGYETLRSDRVDAPAMSVVYELVRSYRTSTVHKKRQHAKEAARDL